MLDEVVVFVGVLVSDLVFYFDDFFVEVQELWCQVYCIEFDLLCLEVEFDVIVVGVELDLVVWVVVVQVIKVWYLLFEQVVVMVFLFLLCFESLMLSSRQEFWDG